ncbi:uncharacterized protein FOMMEDRAFT_110790 [Fomitiporia mediterranea MF3/22]|uniref:uncharacterized protein n=1 Tax=Fomitiporia mediterranea (strain MF3/22) TaxID=694068 RepID=UPI00044081B7|nr:uncharacterized protein FOMMEDRAFT_110790 [Fomitiporia mediterranea MF3/22]EJD01179.1 hypothetical protein FOMMEDRAFT_110790 [Fomitiporia mediterranea MF3/22]
MASEINWEALLDDHPIFSPPSASLNAPELSASLKDLQNDEDSDTAEASGRRQVMCMKDSDLILACGSELRMTSLHDVKMSGGSQRTYKVLHNPSIDFDIRQISLSPNKKLLAVAGVSQVALVVLPRAGFSKFGTSRIDCKSLHIGPYYHSNLSSPLVKIDWHPWGEAGSTLLVMTADGRLREYNVSLDPDEPRKMLDFVPEKKHGSFAAVDESEREVASFTFGKGKADWGPLTLYALMKSGDIYAICPYLPENSSVPSSYLHALECFVSAKEEFVAESNGDLDESFSAIYNYQRKYVNALLKQLPPGSTISSTSQSVPIRAPRSCPGRPLRQGPFLLQPSPPELKDSPGGYATDIAYLTLGSAFSGPDDQSDDEASSLSSERLGVLLVAFQDGRVDVYLDLEKVEAKWDTDSSKSPTASPPALTAYETIDLAIVSSVLSTSDSSNTTGLQLIEGNHLTFYADPIHDDTIYAYHAFGVHVLNLNAIFENLAAAMKEEDENVLKDTMQHSTNTTVQPILVTYSVEQHSTNPVVAVVIPNDVYLTYSIFILTSTMRIVVFTLNLRAESAEGPETSEKSRDVLTLPELPASDPPAYVSLLAAQPFVHPPALSRPMGFPSIAKVLPPKSCNIKEELRVTPETLRYLASVAERITSEMHDAVVVCHTMKNRADLQKQEYERLQKKALEIVERTQRLTGPRKVEVQNRLRTVQAEQTNLLARMERLLQALIRQASPELNEHETRWFEELQRMKAQVLGMGRYDAESLKLRIRQLQTDFERIMPALKELAKEEKERKSRAEENNAGAGHSYAKAYERMSRIESAKLEDAIKQITRLARRLEISNLSTPPS